jgi:hypothetical protein
LPTYVARGCLAARAPQNFSIGFIERFVYGSRVILLLLLSKTGAKISSYDRFNEWGSGDACLTNRNDKHHVFIADRREHDGDQRGRRIGGDWIARTAVDGSNGRKDIQRND